MMTQSPLSYEVWYWYMGGIGQHIDYYQLRYTAMALTLLLIFLAVWALCKLGIWIHRKVKRQEVVNELAQPEEPPVTLPTITNVKITEKLVLELDGHSYYATNVPGILVRRRTEEEMTKRKQPEDDGKGNINKPEHLRTRQDKEDDFWHFVAAAAIIIWLMDSGYTEDSEEMVAMKAFEAESLALSGLDELPNYTAEDFAAVEIDATEVASFNEVAEGATVDASGSENAFNPDGMEHIDDETNPLVDGEFDTTSDNDMDIS